MSKALAATLNAATSAGSPMLGTPGNGEGMLRNAGFGLCIVVCPKAQPDPDAHLAASGKLGLQIGPSIMEFRRYSSLEWDELADLMGVSQHQLFELISGKPASVDQHDRALRLLDVIRRTDKGESHLNRAMLLTPEDRGRRLFDMLKEGLYEEMAQKAGPGNPRKARQFPPLSVVEQEARRPPPPWCLLDALQDRPDIPFEVAPEESCGVSEDQGWT